MGRSATLPKAFVLLSLLAVLTALPVPAAGQEAAAKIDLEAEKKAVADAEIAFAAAGNAKNEDLFRSFIHPEAIYLGARVAHGSDGFYNTWKPLFDPVKEVSLEWEPLVVEVARSGEIAYTIGRGTIRWRKLGTDEFNENPGHFLSVWRKDEAEKGETGEWKLWASGTLVLHENPELGISESPRFALAYAWKWKVLNSPGADTDLTWTTENVWEPESGEFAVSFGAFRVEARRDGENDLGVGHFIEVRTKNGEGRWTLAAGAYTAPMPPPQDESGG